jgi:predicted nuclease of predicted toxin-antitoxin system
MKLLFDENLSPKLPRLLTSQFPGSLHLRDCGLKGATDEEIWEYARANGFTIVSKDSDFYQRSLFYGSPPKFVWLRIGNCTRDDLVALLAIHEQEILALDADPFESVLVLS